MTAYRFPSNFVWGTATASAQVEGAATDGGKGESIWDRFAATPGKTSRGDTPAVACDHYHRYKRDFTLMKKLGIAHYRFSIAWPRIVPGGTGELNPKGLDFYDRFVDALLEKGITPWATLFHWDLPQALEDRGGWRERETAEAYRDYATAVVRRLGDRIKNWMTLNEIPCLIGLAYRQGIHAPGAKESKAVVNQAYHNALLAHGYGVQAVRQYGGRGARVGLVHNPDTCVPVTETPADIAAATAMQRRVTSQLMEPIFRGHYPEVWLKEVDTNAPRVQDGDLELISQKTDFLGLNLYSGRLIRAGKRGKPEEISFPPDYQTGALPWLKIVPQTLYWGIRHAVELYGVSNIFITENGVCFEDVVNERGEVHDLGRREYLRTYLVNLHRAVKEGYRVRGYFVWSFMDNFEWAEGYSKRFGIVHINYKTQRRTPKLSAQWYSEVIRANALV